MTKKTKIATLAVAGVAGVGAVAATIGSIAFFTNTKQSTNTFTIGNVAIELSEKQRVVENGVKTTELTDFVDGQVLYPIVGSAQGAKDAIGMPTSAAAQNYVDKMVSVENTASGDAWVRVYVANRSELDDGFDSFDASQNGLHFNFGTNADGSLTRGVTWDWFHDGDNDGTEDEWNYYETTIDGKPYNVYYADYMTTLSAGETTTRVINGLYLDKSVTVKDGNLWAPVNLANPDSALVDLGVDASEQIKMPVFAVAIQSSGYNSAEEAVNSAFGAQYNPWGGEVSNWQ